MKEKNKVTRMSYCNITPFSMQSTQGSTIIKDVAFRIGVVNVCPPAKVEVKFLCSQRQVMVKGYVRVTGIQDVFELLHLREEVVPGSATAKDGFIFWFKSRAEDGKMTGAEFMTEGAFVRGAARVTMTVDFAISANVVGLPRGFITDTGNRHRRGWGRFRWH